MKIAFDLDGTISKYPSQLIGLATSLQKAGADVFVLTAAAGELPPEQRPAEVGRRLAKLGGSHLRVVCIEQRDKPDYCKRHNVDLLIDDTRFALETTVQLMPL